MLLDEKVVDAVSIEVATYDANGTIVQFEVEPVPGFAPAGYKDVVGSIGEAVRPVLAAACAVLEQAQRMTPDTVQVKFGIKVTGTANWLVAKAASEASFEVTLTWNGNATNVPIAEMH